MTNPVSMVRASLLQRGRHAVARHAMLVVSVAALAGCARVNTALDHVNAGLAALADTTRTTGRRASRAGAAPAAGAARRATVPLTLAQPVAERSDTLTAASEGTHRYTLHELDTRAWAEGGVLTVEIDVADGWDKGTSIASFDLYPEGVAPTRTGLPDGAVASAWNVAPGHRATLTHQFGKGQRFLLGAEGSWSSRAGSRNLYTFRVRVTPSATPLWTAEGTAAEGGASQTLTVWEGARSISVLGGDMAVTVPAARARAWGEDLTRWLARAERREATACAAQSGETISGPALADASGSATPAGAPAVVVTCALRRGAGARLLPSYELSVATADGYSHAVTVRATQLRQLAAALGSEARERAP